MSLIDPRAIIDPSARLAADVQVGPWSIVGAEVEIGEGTVIGPHVVLKGPTKIGKHNRIYQFSSVGEDTPDLKYKGEPTRLVIGDHNVIREGVTIHRGTVQDRAETMRLRRRPGGDLAGLSAWPLRWPDQRGHHVAGRDRLDRAVRRGDRTVYLSRR